MSEKVTENKVLIAGSRKSQLAVIQTECIMESLKKNYPETTFKIETMNTFGDRVLNKALPKMGEKSLFTKDLEIALAEGRVDFLVHSLKDLPTALPQEMAIGAIPSRDDPRDVVIFHPKHICKTIDEMPEGSVIGTSSLRRIAQLKRKYPNLIFENVRGNLNTRLKKLDEDDKYDALVLAAAGVHRMRWSHRIGQMLDKNDCLYAVGQGALAIEVKTNDVKQLSIYAALNDTNTLLCCLSERAFLRKLEGGCSVPIGVWCDFDQPKFELTGSVSSLDGSVCIQRSISTHIEIPSAMSEKYHVTDSMMVIDSSLKEAVKKAEDIGNALADILRKDGACDLLQEARDQIAKTQNDLRMPKTT